MKKIDPEIRFWQKVDKTKSCWLWMGARGKSGYGLFAVSKDRKAYGAHRYVWEITMGPIPKNLVIDHLCRNKLCVNPDHLEPVTQRENVMRGNGPTAVNARMTHCWRGHEFTEENIYRSPSQGYRVCRKCKSINQKERTERIRSKSMIDFEGRKEK